MEQDRSAAGREIETRARLKRPRLVRHLAAAALTLLAAALFLFSPRPKPNEQIAGWYVELFPGAGAVISKDARSFSVPAEDLELLFSVKRIRQSRPLYIVAGKICGLLVKALTLNGAELPYYWGYVILNLILLHFSLALFLKICADAGADPLLALAAAPLLAFNNVTKLFLWTPHQQMFAVFAPLLALELTALILDRGLSRRAAVQAGTMTGALCLAYGSFILLAPGLLAAAVIQKRRQPGPVLRPLAAPATLFIALTLLPTLVWIGWVTLVTGKYYNHEIEYYRQLVWVMDAARFGPAALLHAVGVNTRKFLETFSGLDVSFFLAAALAAAGTELVRRRLGRDPIEAPLRREALTAAAITFTAFLAFFGALGYYAERLTFSIAPPALVAAVVVLGPAPASSPRATAVARAAAAAVSAAWAMYHVFSYGPF